MFRTKFNLDGSINKHKEKLIMKGYYQIIGINYSYNFSPVASHDTIQLLLFIVAQKGWQGFHMDIKTTFLNGFLQDGIYVEQPKGFSIKGKQDRVYLLKKAFYDVKQASIVWYNKINDPLLQLELQKNLYETTLYIKHVGAYILITSL